MDTENPIGNYLPKWTGSMNNSFTWKNISLSFMLDLRVGGDIYMNSLARGSQYGTTEMTLVGRDEWYAGTGGIVVDGVTESGEINTKAANPQDYWNRVSRAGEEFVYDGTSLRLRELTIGYSLPKKVFGSWMTFREIFNSRQRQAPFTTAGPIAAPYSTRTARSAT